jgi:hypothetical protein
MLPSDGSEETQVIDETLIVRVKGKVLKAPENKHDWFQDNMEALTWTGTESDENSTTTLPFPN